MFVGVYRSNVSLATPFLTPLLFVHDAFALFVQADNGARACRKHVQANGRRNNGFAFTVVWLCPSLIDLLSVRRRSFQLKSRAQRRPGISNLHAITP